MAMSLSLGGTSLTTRPSMMTSPSEISLRPAIIRRVVDLPQPERTDQDDELLVLDVDVELPPRRRAYRLSGDSPSPRRGPPSPFLAFFFSWCQTAYWGRSSLRFSGLLLTFPALARPASSAMGGASPPPAMRRAALRQSPTLTHRKPADVLFLYYLYVRPGMKMECERHGFHYILLQTSLLINPVSSTINQSPFCQLSPLQRKKAPDETGAL